MYGSLLEIGEFDLIISFANPMAGEDWTTTTVTLKGCILSLIHICNMTAADTASIRVRNMTKYLVFRIPDRKIEIHACPVPEIGKIARA